MDKEVDKEVYMELQMMEQQMNQLQQQNEHFEEKMNEARELKKGMEAFSKLNAGDEILIPVSNGIFARGKLLDTKNLKVNVGSGVLAGKTVEKTISLMEGQIIELKKLQEKSSKDLDKMMEKATKLASKLQ